MNTENKSHKAQYIGKDIFAELLYNLINKQIVKEKQNIIGYILILENTRYENTFFEPLSVVIERCIELSNILKECNLKSIEMVEKIERIYKV